VTVGIVDTGIAYADRGPFRRSPDIAPSRIVRGYDFVDGDPYPNDRNGHGTFVASTVAAAADNGYGMVGVAFQAKLMPVRVLDGDGAGTGTRIARGLRWAVDHGADVLNVSIELYDRLTLQAQSMTTDPAIRDAVRYAARHRVLVVAASGNSSSQSVPSTRLGGDILYVGGTTEHGCLGDYSNYGPGLDLVAPGGGRDADFPDGARSQHPAGLLQASELRALPARARQQRPPRLQGHVDGGAPRDRRGGAPAGVRRAGPPPDARGDPGAAPRDGHGPRRAWSRPALRRWAVERRGGARRLSAGQKPRSSG
jgi:hypothetical protein